MWDCEGVFAGAGGAWRPYRRSAGESRDLGGAGVRVARLGIPMI